MKMKSTLLIVLGVFVLSTKNFYLSAQSNISYIPFYTQSTFNNKTIDKSKAVGVVLGSADVVNGAATYSIPIASAPIQNTNVYQPSLSITYNSNAQNGILGKGWNLAGLPSIQRINKSYSDYGYNSQSFNGDFSFEMDGLLLTPVTINNDFILWKTENENFSEIKSYFNNPSNNGSSNIYDDVSYWEVTTKDGLVMTFTPDFPDSKYTGSNKAQLVGTTSHKYSLSHVLSKNLLFMMGTTISREQIGMNTYVSEINNCYGKIKFNYKTGLNHNTFYLNGEEISFNQLIDNIEIYNVDNENIRTYFFKYSNDNLSSFLSEVSECVNSECKNSTIFLYGERHTNNNFITQSIPYLTPPSNNSSLAKYYVSGDYNGDGFTDYITYDLFGLKSDELYNEITGYRVFLNNKLGGFTLSQNIDVTSFNTYINNKDFNSSIISADYDGDGIDDVIEYEMLNINNITKINSRKILFFNENGTINYNKTLNLDVGLYNNIRYDRVKPDKNFSLLGDFDGNGSVDQLLILGNSSNSYECFISFYSRNIFNQRVFIPKQIQNAKELISLDFDGDKKTDILALYDNKYEVFTTNELGDWINIAGGPNFNSTYIVRVGDFNGDGKSDILYANDNNLFKIAYSDGQSFKFNNATIFTEKYPSISKSFESLCIADYIELNDFNGDGKTDILHAYKKNNNECRTVFSLYLSKGVEFKKMVYSGNENIHFECNSIIMYNSEIFDGMNVISGDFNGDGIADINANVKSGPQSYYNSCNTFNSVSYHRQSFYFFDKFHENSLLSIKNGFGQLINFQYNTLSKLNIGKTFNGTLTYNENFYTSIPLKVAININDELSNKNISFNYFGALLNNKGRGFIGYRLIEANDIINNVITRFHSNKYTNFNLFKNVLLIDYIEKFKGSTLIETTRNYYNNYNVVQVPLIWNGVFNNIKLIKSETSSYFSGNTTIEYEYDNFGNLTLEKKLNADGYLTEKIIDYGNTAANRPSLPASTIVNYKHNNKPTISYQTNYEYTPLFQLKKKTEFPNLANPIITEYKYDWRGNITESSVKGNNMPLRKIEFIYDADNLFLSKKKNSIGQEEIYEMDRRFNKPTKITGIDGLSTSFVYNPFGNLTTTLYPDNTTKTSFLSWASNPMPVECVYFNAEWTSPSPSPLNAVYYDKNNKKIIEYSLADNKEITKSFFYDSRNRLFKTTTKEDQAVVSQIENHFDDYDRPINSLIIGKDPSISLTTNNITYTKSSNFWEITESTPPSPTNPSGSSQYKKVSLAGELLETEQNNTNKLTYNYDAEGKNTKIIFDNVVVSEIKYDPYGRKMELIDNSAAKQKYEYNSLGELSKQTNANNGFIRYEYDVLGRKTKEILNEGTILYTYFPSGSGAKTNKIKQIKNYNNAQEDFDYDPLGRLIEIKTRILGLPQPLNTVSKQITYNALSQIEKIKTPTGNIYEYLYTPSGTLQKIQKGGQNIYEVLDKDAFGNPITIKTGNQSIQYEYDNWLKVNKIQSPFIHDEYTWDPMNGNLMTKNEIHHNFSYTYSYDQFEQMTNESLNNAIHNPVNYNPNGNIKDKFSVNENESEYIYHSSNSKMFAVKNIYDLDLGDFSGYVQSIVNNSSNRPTKITQGNYRLEMSYDHSQDRATSFLYHNNIISNKKYYFGNSEMNFDKNNTLKYALDYIYAGDQLVAIDYKDHTNTNKLHYVHQDYLGNIRAVFDDNNNAFYQNFDAWGNWRETNDPNHLGAIRYEKPSTLPEWLSRGYTTHEHLPEFRLINMNARLYDPNIGRMLSPDNYATDNTLQGFNRYTYAHNNPVKFADPDGNLPVIAAFAIGFGAGILSNGVSNIAGGRSFFSGDFDNWMMAGFMGGVSGAFTMGMGSLIDGATATFGKIGTELIRAGAHATYNGAMATTSGSSFWSGAASGGASSLLSSAYMKYGSEFGDVGGYLLSGVGGGASAAMAGGDFFQGAATGLMVHGLNHVWHAVTGKQVGTAGGDEVDYKVDDNWNVLDRADVKNVPVTMGTSMGELFGQRKFGVKYVLGGEAIESVDWECYAFGGGMTVKASSFYYKNGFWLGTGKLIYRYAHNFLNQGAGWRIGLSASKIGNKSYDVFRIAHKNVHKFDKILGKKGTVVNKNLR